jgi:hypothetical protein
MGMKLCSVVDNSRGYNERHHRGIPEVCYECNPESEAHKKVRKILEENMTKYVESLLNK